MKFSNWIKLGLVLASLLLLFPTGVMAGKEEDSGNSSDSLFLICMLVLLLVQVIAIIIAVILVSVFVSTVSQVVSMPRPERVSEEEEEEEEEQTAVSKSVAPKTKTPSPTTEEKEVDQKTEEFQPIVTTPFPTAPTTYTNKKKPSDEENDNKEGKGGPITDPFRGASTVDGGQEEEGEGEGGEDGDDGLGGGADGGDDGAADNGDYGDGEGGNDDGLNGDAGDNNDDLDDAQDGEGGAGANAGPQNRRPVGGVPAASQYVAPGNANRASTWMTDKDKTNAPAAGTPVPQTFGTVTPAAPGATPAAPPTPSGPPKNPTAASVFLMKKK